MLNNFAGTISATFMETFYILKSLCILTKLDLALVNS